MPNVWREVDQPGTFVDLPTHLLTQRTVFIGAELESVVANHTAMQILALAGRGEPIHLYLNCCGGSMPAGLAVVDMIRYAISKGTPIHTYCLGECLGVAAAILASGTSGQRHVFPSGRLSLFQEWYGVETLYGNDVQSTEDERDRLIGMMVATFRRAGVRRPSPDGERQGDDTPDKGLRDLLRTQHFLDAEMALEYGLADEVVNVGPQLATASLGRA